MSRQHTGHHVIDVNTLSQLHEQGEVRLGSIIPLVMPGVYNRRE